MPPADAPWPVDYRAVYRAYCIAHAVRLCNAAPFVAPCLVAHLAAHHASSAAPCLLRQGGCLQPTRLWPVDYYLGPARASLSHDSGLALHFVPLDANLTLQARM